jgi:hypothetical protein
MSYSDEELKKILFQSHGQEGKAIKQLMDERDALIKSNQNLITYPDELLENAEINNAEKLKVENKRLREERDYWINVYNESLEE